MEDFCLEIICTWLVYLVVKINCICFGGWGKVLINSYLETSYKEGTVDL